MRRLHFHHITKDHQYNRHLQQSHQLQEYRANIDLRSHKLMRKSFQARRLPEAQAACQMAYNKDHHIPRLHNNLTSKNLR
jgi:hypothetical protein